jgi:hypothetical protein
VIPFDLAEAPQWEQTKDDAKLWIIRNQLGRCNLEPFAKIELAERVRPLLEARAKANQQAAGGAVPQKSIVI